MEKQQAREMKKALNVLKAILTWACRERDKVYGEPAFCIRGNQLSYSSFAGTTAGVNLPGPRVPGEPVYVKASVLKAALTNMPGELTIDHVNTKINGITFTLADSVMLAERTLALDVNQTFGRVKTSVTIPLPGALEDVRTAEAEADIRYYLNGVCFDLESHAIVATNGHRMHVANSDTLPALAVNVLDTIRPKGLDPEVRQPCQFILTTWQLDLLKKIGAEKLSIGRFPEQEKGDASLPGWPALSKTTQCVLVRAKGEYGFLIGKTCDGVYPDWNRVAPTKKKLIETREFARDIPVQYEKWSESGESYLYPERKKEADKWRSQYPRSVVFPDDAVEALRRFIKASKAANPDSKVAEYGYGVELDLIKGVVRNPRVDGVPLELSIRVIDQLEYDPSRDDHIVGVNAAYMADALEYVGPEGWFIAKDRSFVAHKDSRSAVVMPMRT